MSVQFPILPRSTLLYTVRFPPKMTEKFFSFFLSINPFICLPPSLSTALFSYPLFLTSASTRFIPYPSKGVLSSSNVVTIRWLLPSNVGCFNPKNWFPILCYDRLQLHRHTVRSPAEILTLVRAIPFKWGTSRPTSLDFNSNSSFRTTEIPRADFDYMRQYTLHNYPKSTLCTYQVWLPLTGTLARLHSWYTSPIAINFCN